MTDIHDTADLVSKALRRAWQLGQTYWQQADSEYQSHWKKADATQATFDQLVKDTRAVILADNSGAQPAPSVPEDVMRDAERYRYLRARDDGTAGVGCWIEADGRVCDRGWLNGDQLDSAIDSFIEVLAAAAPEAKP